MKSELRIYNKPNCSLFDLLDGGQEPKQTKALGYLLANSNSFRQEFLKLIGKEELNNNEFDIVVDCEKSTTHKRLDILIRVYDSSKRPIHAIIIEAKSIKSSLRASIVGTQLLQYIQAFSCLQAFGPEVSGVSLTNVIDYRNSAIISITWYDILRILVELVESSEKEFLVSDYFKFLISL